MLAKIDCLSIGAIHLDLFQAELRQQHLQGSGENLVGGGSSTKVPIIFRSRAEETGRAGKIDKSLLPKYYIGGCEIKRFAKLQVCTAIFTL